MVNSVDKGTKIVWTLRLKELSGHFKKKIIFINFTMKWETNGLRYQKKYLAELTTVLRIIFSLN